MLSINNHIMRYRMSYGHETNDIEVTLSYAFIICQFFLCPVCLVLPEHFTFK